MCSPSTYSIGYLISGLLLVDEPMDLCIGGVNGTVNMNVTMETMTDTVFANSGINNTIYLVNTTNAGVL